MIMFAINNNRYLISCTHVLHSGQYLQPGDQLAHTELPAEAPLLQLLGGVRQGGRGQHARRIHGEPEY